MLYGKKLIAASLLALTLAACGDKGPQEADVEKILHQINEMGRLGRLMGQMGTTGYDLRSAKILGCDTAGQNLYSCRVQITVTYRFGGDVPTVIRTMQLTKHSDGYALLGVQ